MASHTRLRCAQCTIEIFTGEEAAASAGRHYQFIVNGAIGDLCYGCANSDPARIGLLEEQALQEAAARRPKDKDMKKISSQNSQNGSPLPYESFETGAGSPPGQNIRSKYFPMVAALQELWEDPELRTDWCRFKFTSPKYAQNARTFITKGGRMIMGSQGVELESMVRTFNSNESWVYGRDMTAKPQIEYHTPTGRVVICDLGAGWRIEKEIKHEARKLDPVTPADSNRPRVVVSARPFLQITHRRAGAEGEPGPERRLGTPLPRQVRGVTP